MTLGFAPETIETWPLARLKPYARDAKTHGPEQVAKIAASIGEFGWTVPVLVGEDGEVIAGHDRILAAETLGLAEAPVIVLGHLTEAQRRAYRLADNKLTELGGWPPSRPSPPWSCRPSSTHLHQRNGAPDCLKKPGPSPHGGQRHAASRATVRCGLRLHRGRRRR